MPLATTIATRLTRTNSTRLSWVVMKQIIAMLAIAVRKSSAENGPGRAAAAAIKTRGKRLDQAVLLKHRPGRIVPAKPSKEELCTHVLRHSRAAAASRCAR